MSVTKFECFVVLHTFLLCDSRSEKSSDDIVRDLASDIIRQLPETVEELAEGDVRASTSGSTMFQLQVKHILTKELPDYRDKEKNKCKTF